MPRLAPKLLNWARQRHPLLPSLLYATRDVQSAKIELRWLKDCALEQCTAGRGSRRYGWRQKLRDLCIQRSRGKPLQYLLGSEYFGDLEILCRPGVLIPRQETAASVTYLVTRLRNHLPKALRVLDLCTGTGCIPLLFHHDFYKRRSHGKIELDCLGVDISTKAISLARANCQRCMQAGAPEKPQLNAMRFIQADILCETGSSNIPSLKASLQEYEGGQSHAQDWDILISNPPYISPQEFCRTTTRSVRNYEPKLALVPNAAPGLDDNDAADLFYPRLLQIADKVKAKIVLFEVADLAQARRVAAMALRDFGWVNVEIWRDQPTFPGGIERCLEPDLVVKGVKVRGVGNGRSVFAWREGAERWLRVG